MRDKKEMDEINMPLALKPLFWDIDFAALTWKDHRDFIIRRILQSGSLESLCWLRKQICDLELRQWIIDREGRGLNPRQIRYWEIVYDLDHTIVNNWLISMRNNPWEMRLHGEVQSLRVSFLEFRYPLLQPFVFCDKTACNLVSMDDLACMKIAAIAQRGSKKDFVDLFVLGTKYRPLADFLPLYQIKFSVQDLIPVFYGLAYFDDAEAEPMPQMPWDVDWSQVKKLYLNG